MLSILVFFTISMAQGQLQSACTNAPISVLESHNVDSVSKINDSFISGEYNNYRITLDKATTLNLLKARENRQGGNSESVKLLHKKILEMKVKSEPLDPSDIVMALVASYTPENSGVLIAATEMRILVSISLQTGRALVENIDFGTVLNQLTVEKYHASDSNYPDRVINGVRITNNFHIVNDLCFSDLQ